MGVDVVHRKEHLPASVHSVVFGKALLLNDTLEEFAAGHALHDEVQPLRSLVHIHQARDVGVVHGQENLTLALQLFPFRLAHTDELEALNGYSGARRFVRGQEHLAVVARAEHLVRSPVVVRELLGQSVEPAGDRDLADAALRPLRRILQAAGPAADFALV
eukprot:CAMPEP_0183596478 /NCGR_PEP_ID=MMETSP0371-20130417/175183_1 /TAXON_ID=268820 /ORGANISM="Peridinium aciculiferum, Strain PAER-2" /LENGTH=160 /DNA_ID=CAMNT_0025808355 /DNA_START=61 /DNA_END=539 /DNA_ORIENTATION=-